jgi:hypothetical protein
MTDLQENVYRTAGRVGPQSASRRGWLRRACAAAALLAFAGAARLGAPFGVALALAEPAAGADLDAFLALSRRLTGRSRFDPVLGKRVYGALAQADSQFVQNVAALDTWLNDHGGVPSDTVTQALEVDEPALAKTVRAVMRAWYLGLVGEMPNVQVVAYERALMFDPVRSVLTIPSYCRDVPFYWASQPTAA